MRSVNIMNIPAIIRSVCWATEYTHNRKNLKYCRKHGLRLFEFALGRTKKDRREDHKTICDDAVDRIEVERILSLAKRHYELGLISTKPDMTTRSSIWMSIIAMNDNRLTVA